MGSVVPELQASDARRSIQSNLMVFEAIVKGISEPLRVLIDSGASDNFCRAQTLRKYPRMWECVKHSQGTVAIRLATGIVKRSPERIAVLQLTFSDINCEEQFVLLDMDERYDLILGINWLKKHEPWIDWRSGSIPASQVLQNKASRDVAIPPADSK